MRLVARLYAMSMRPLRPLRGEVLQQHIAQCLTIVNKHLRRILANVEQQLWQMVLQFIPSALLELNEDGGCPIGPIDLVAIVEKGIRIRHLIISKRLFESLQIVSHCLCIKMVDCPSFSTRSSSFHQLLGASHIDSKDLPSAFAIFRFPRQHIVSHHVGKIQRRSLHVKPVGHHLMHPGSLPCLSPVFIRRRSSFQVLRRCKVQLGFRDSVHQLHDPAHMLHLNGIHTEHHPASSFRLWHLRTAKGPSCASIHVYLHAITDAQFLDILQHLHPA